MKNKKGHESFSNEHEMDEKEDEKHQKISLRWNLKVRRDLIDVFFMIKKK